MDRSDWLGKQVVFQSPYSDSYLDGKVGVVVGCDNCENALVYFFDSKFGCFLNKLMNNSAKYIQFPHTNCYCCTCSIMDLYPADENLRVFKYNIGDKVKYGSVNGIVVGYNLDLFNKDCKMYLVCLESGGTHNGDGWSMIADLRTEYEGKCRWLDEKDLCVNDDANSNLDTKAPKFNVGDKVWVVNSNDPTYHKKGIIFAYDHNNHDAEMSTYRVYFEDEDPELHDCGTHIKALDNHCWHHVAEDLELYTGQDKVASKENMIVFDDENLIPVRVKPDDQLPYGDTAEEIGFTPGKVYFWNVRENYLVDDGDKKRPLGNFSQKDNLQFLMSYFDIVRLYLED